MRNDLTCQSTHDFPPPHLFSLSFIIFYIIMYILFFIRWSKWRKKTASFSVDAGDIWTENCTSFMQSSISLWLNQKLSYSAMLNIFFFLVIICSNPWIRSSQRCDIKAENVTYLYPGKRQNNDTLAVYLVADVYAEICNNHYIRKCCFFLHYYNLHMINGS